MLDALTVSLYISFFFPPLGALGKLAEEGDWCFVVVGDTTGPDVYDVPGVIYLTPEKQRKLNYRIIDHIPWRHFGRKNIGFLYAIERGAKIIYDTDDDNWIQFNPPFIPIMGEDGSLEDVNTKAISEKKADGSQGMTQLGEKLTVRTYDLSGEKADRLPVLNAYGDFNATCGKIWPRGYPLDKINTYSNPPLREVEKLRKPPAIQQFLANDDPDVDAM